MEQAGSRSLARSGGPAGGRQRGVVTLGVGALSAWLSFAVPALAAEAPRSAAAQAERATSRHLVWVQLASPEAETQAENLEALLSFDLERLGMSAEIGIASGSLVTWLADARRDPEALLLVALDARRAERWRVLLVDAERSRAVLREIPGGVAADAAALEAVASIVTSAAAALGEGLEVGSRSIDEVVEEEVARERPIEEEVAREQPGTEASSATETPPPRDAAPAPDVAPGASPPPQPTTGRATSRPPSARWDLPRPTWSVALSGVGCRASGPGVAIGGAAAVAWRSRSWWGLRLAGQLHRAERYSAPEGSFSLQRTLGLATARLEHDGGRWEVELEGGGVVEAMRRAIEGTEAGTSASADRTLWRVGAMLGPRLRWRMLPWLALDSSLAAIAYGRALSFAVAPQGPRLATSPAYCVIGQLGVEFGFGAGTEAHAP